MIDYKKAWEESSAEAHDLRKQVLILNRQVNLLEEKLFSLRHMFNYKNSEQAMRDAIFVLRKALGEE